MVLYSMAKKIVRQSVPSPPFGGTDPNAVLSSNVSSSGNVPARENAPLAIDTATKQQASQQGTNRVVGAVKITFQGIDPANPAGAEFHVSVFLWPLIWALIAAYGSSPPLFPGGKIEEDMLLQGMFPATGFQIVGPQRDCIIEALESAIQTPDFMEGPSKSYEDLDIGAAYPQLRELPKPSFSSGEFLKKCDEFLNFLKNNNGYTAEVQTSQVSLSPQKPGQLQTPVQDEIRVCLQCGRPNGRSNKFCLVCGKKFDELDADASMLAKALAPDPKTLADWAKKARSLAAAGDHEAALDFYEKLMPYKGNDASFWNEIGKELQQLGREDAAREAFNKAAPSKPATTMPGEVQQKPRYCSKCGRANKNTAKFCIACGYKFS